MPNIDIGKLSNEISDIYTVINNTFMAVPKADEKDKIEVEVGDSKQVDFLPQVKIMRWDNEVNLSYRLKTDGKENEVITQEDEKIIWDKGNYQVQTYDLPISADNPEGGMEFEVILKKPPKTNVIEFTLNDKDVDYFYQPELTQEEIAEGASRPENVVGSYAVYAKTPKTNWTGGKEYKVGKVGHIFRPKIIDSVGTEVWGDLHIENGILSVTIPQSFLDKAVYPVIVDPTFGFTSSSSTRQAINLGNGPWQDYKRVGHSNYSPANNGTVDKISAYICSGYSATNLSSNTYIAVNEKDSGGADSHGKIASVVENGVSYPGYTTPGVALHDFTVTGSPAVLSSVNYVLDMGGTSVQGTGASCCVVYDTGSSHYNYFELFRDNAAGLSEDPWTVTPTSDTRVYSIYATYTASASGPEKLKTWNGLETAKIKTINGLVIAKVKTINGLP